MEIELAHIADSPTLNTFRVAFHDSDQRYLLPYPCVTGLMFTNSSGSTLAEWKTGCLVSEPLDDFVLNPGARIAFDLYANINPDADDHRWGINLPVGKYNVHYSYCVERDTDWYDFLARRSRFAALTPIWRGSVQSDTIPFSVMQANEPK